MLFTVILPSSQDEAKKLVDEARTLIEDKEYEQAVDKADLAVEKAPDYATAYSVRAEAEVWLE